MNKVEIDLREDVGALTLSGERLKKHFVAMVLPDLVAFWAEHHCRVLDEDWEGVRVPAKDWTLAQRELESVKEYTRKSFFMASMIATAGACEGAHVAENIAEPHAVFEAGSGECGVKVTVRWRNTGSPSLEVGLGHLVADLVHRCIVDVVPDDVPLGVEALNTAIYRWYQLEGLAEQTDMLVELRALGYHTPPEVVVRKGSWGRVWDRAISLLTRDFFFEVFGLEQPGGEVRVSIPPDDFSMGIRRMREGVLLFVRECAGQVPIDLGKGKRTDVVAAGNRDRFVVRIEVEWDDSKERQWIWRAFSGALGVLLVQAREPKMQYVVSEQLSAELRRLVEAEERRVN